MEDTWDLRNLSDKARKSLLESPKFGGNPYGYNSRIRKTKEFRAMYLVWTYVEKPFNKTTNQ